MPYNGVDNWRLAGRPEKFGQEVQRIIAKNDYHKLFERIHTIYYLKKEVDGLLFAMARNMYKRLANSKTQSVTVRKL